MDVDSDYLLHHAARWSGFAFALVIFPAGLAYVYLVGKKSAAKTRAFRCVAAQVRHPGMALRLSVAMTSIGFAYVAIARWNDREPDHFARLIVTGGMTLSVLSTFGIAAWRQLISHTNQTTLFHRETVGAVPEAGVGIDVISDSTAEFVNTGDRVVFTGRHLATVEGAFPPGERA